MISLNSTSRFQAWSTLLLIHSMLPNGSKTNGLKDQLKLVARLLAGRCKTKVFLVKIGGFDTHADQVEKYDPTMGSHAALMYHVSSSMKAFQEIRARRSGRSCVDYYDV